MQLTNNPEVTPLKKRVLIAIELHELISRGEIESARAEELREASADIWDQLTEQEQLFVHQVSADLHMLSGAEKFEKYEPGMGQLRLLLRDAYSRDDARQFLTLLRFGYGELEPYVVAYFRWKFYRKIGFSELALKFIEFAIRECPKERAFFEVARMNTLVDLYSVRDALDIGLLLLRSETKRNEVVIVLCSLVIELSWKYFRDAHQNVCEEIKQKLRSVQVELLSKDSKELRLIVLFHCYKILGNTFLAAEAGAEFDEMTQTHVLVAENIDDIVASIENRSRDINKKFETQLSAA